MNWKLIFNNKYVLKFIQYYNLIMLILYTVGCYVYVYDNEIYKSVYKVLISLLGFNLSSQIFVGYLLSKLKFCQWQTIAFLFNIIINILGISINLLSDFYVIDHDLLAMTVLSTVFTTYTIIYILYEKSKNKSIKI